MEAIGYALKSNGLSRAIGEGGFVGFEELLGSFCGGSYDARDRTKKKVYDGSIAD